MFLSFSHPLLEFAGTENGLKGRRFPILSFAFQGFQVFDKKSRKKVRSVCHGFMATQASVPWSRTRHLPPQDLVPEFPSDIHSRISFLRLSVCHHVLTMPLACCFGRQGSSESGSCANTESSPEEQALWVSWPLGEYCSKATDRSMYSCEEENNSMNISTERTTSSSTQGHLLLLFSWARTEIPPPMGETFCSPHAKGCPAFNNPAVV